MSEKVFSEPTWAIVELFGRQVIAGLISEVAVAGSDMLRVNVPAVGEAIAAYTKFYGNGAIYAITPTDEESARHAVAHLRLRPIDEWTIPARQLPELEGSWKDPPELGAEDGPGFVEEMDIPY